MVRFFSLAASLVAIMAVSAHAQIISNPVVTSWPPYGTAVAGNSACCAPAPPPVSPSVCAPPVVTFCNPCATGTMPATTAYYPPATTAYRVVPTTTYYAPTTTAYYAPATTSYAAPATTTYYAPTTAYYGRTSFYRAPEAAVTTFYPPAMATSPTTSYYAPSSPGPTTYSAPVTPSRGCGCNGGR